MVSGLLIAVLVLVLSAYWFRYNCHSILKTATSRDRIESVASANQLSFLQIESRLITGRSAADLRAMNEALRRDYNVLTCLLRYTAAPGSAFTLDQRMLMADFRLLLFWYAFTRRLYLASSARNSLAARARILAYFAHSLSTRTVAVARA